MAVEGADPDGTPFTCDLNPAGDGWFEGRAPGIGAGARYRFRLPDGRLLPDPASRFQPEGVHGPSMVVDPAAYAWHDGDWRAPPLDSLTFYELHVGSFTPAGTFRGVAGQLPYLQELGVGAIELMPVADFAGRWNWGYDGVALFAPCRCYGTPDDLRALVDAAHQAGIAVFLDVVYNHLGPDGAYVGSYSPDFFTDRHRTPWGGAINYDGGVPAVREFVVASAIHWVREYHVDGLRLDATHAIVDESREHILAELARRVRAAVPRPVTVIAEDHRNLSLLIRPVTGDGYGLDGVWADDFHHIARRRLAGDDEGYFADFRGTTAELAECIRQGWWFTGQPGPVSGRRRGTDPGGRSLAQFVVCLQNHDQVGNRAMGDRLPAAVTRAVWRAASLLLLAVPETPLIFMGQEWAASAPFQYFTDHHDDLGRQVTEGRRREFAAFRAFADPSRRARIPDPQDGATFRRSHLDWSEREDPACAPVLRLHQKLLRFRASFRPGLVDVGAPDNDTLWLTRRARDDGAILAAVVRLGGSGEVTWPPARTDIAEHAWTIVLSTEEDGFAPDPDPILLADGRLHFGRPGGAILRGTAATES